MVILAGLYTLESKGKEDVRYNFKKKLLKFLLDKGFSKEKIYNVFEFLDGILFLPTDLELNFYREVEESLGGEDTVTKEMTNLYQAAKEEGKKEGIEEGKLEMIKNLLKTGVDMNKVVKASGLSKEKIEQIKERAKH
ncbi:hypothetical protein Halha_2099 [Halobacteroides halobius DSM 5150]|uniref:Transposase (putative) YhgA-like domain-containing protein n=1 Tax=Halobacteroides halobius (strain ATCC 35273 / DSM 5150 / MD-1) TaxID=748449 RepID=L0KC85_HALHC|nr:hypothetical protein [Halobacteroides halobius]AGB41984.1 hypothetical protein Halha_2099 [Halobacteroides halobius DSM 5150]